MAKKLPADQLRTLADYCFSSYFVELPPGYEFTDLFAGGFFSHHRRLKKNDLIRIKGPDFDCFFVVTAAPQGGAMIDLWPSYPAGNSADAARAAAAKALESRPSIVPILGNGKPAVRVDHTGATKWRVIALDQTTLKEGLETKGEAQMVMMTYLRSLGMTLPSDEEIAEALEKAKEVQKERIKPRKTETV